MEESGSSLSVSTLTCDEDITRCSSGDDESFADWSTCARSDSVQWILKMKACFGFSAKTAYLAVSYFDRFLARRTIDEGKAWALRLLSMACLSLAAKMEELRPPALSEFQFEDYQFDNATMQRMELLVLNTLEWRMSSLTPFAYLEQFASQIQCDEGLDDPISKAIGFIFAIIRVMNILDWRPSAMAAAAILAASGEVLTKKLVEAKISDISLPESIEAEHVFACYNVMIQESRKEKVRKMEVLATSLTSSSCKRRRLL